MVQLELTEAIAEGEWSLVFFRGEFSHAVLKFPAANDIFVQRSKGGWSELRIPSPRLIDQALNVLSTVSDIQGQLLHNILYARVDGVIINDLFTLMELELIEPGLFLDSDVHAAERFSMAIKTVV